MSDKPLILIGYWKENDHDEDYPDPNKFIDGDFWEKHSRAQNLVVVHLTSGKPCNHYRGFSSCRICGEILGTFERTDGVYVWPDKLEHYILRHDVVLPKEFIDHVLTNGNPSPVFKTDDTMWKAWAKGRIDKF